MSIKKPQHPKAKSYKDYQKEHKAQAKLGYKPEKGFWNFNRANTKSK